MGGRPRKPVKNARGRAILAALEAKGLGVYAAADKAGISYDAMSRVLHEPDAGWLQVRTVVAVCEHLGLPLELVAPCLARINRQPAG